MFGMFIIIGGVVGCICIIIIIINDVLIDIKLKNLFYFMLFLNELILLKQF